MKPTFNSLKLRGEVEVDEVYEAVGRKGLRGVVKPKRRGRGRLRGRSTEDKLPFITIRKRYSKKVLFKVLEDVSSPSIESLLALSVEGPVVYTDEFRSYNALDKLGYEHLKVNHSKGFYALGQLHVNGCESYNWHLRTFLRSKRGISRRKASFHANGASAYARTYVEKPISACNWLITITIH
ncbi:MAG: IS1595 family transposase [Nitrososphaerota archaeon]